ncbi:universal stress protein [bacterium]|nr:universal stress protein [bacterium]
MKKIICPVDFSALSQVALHVAAQLSIDFKTELWVVHVAHFVVGNEVVDQSLASTGVVEDMEKERLQLQSLVKTLPLDQSLLRTKMIVKAGYLTEELQDLGDAESLIVSGTSGTHDWINKLLGSITGELFFKGNTPVLMIPKGYQYKPFSHICFATDLMSTPQWNLDVMLEMAEVWGAHLAVLNVMDDTKRVDVESVEESFVHQYLQKSRYDKTSFHVCQASSPIKGIKKFVKEQHMDLLVLTHRKRSFWAALLENSTSEEFVAHPEIPVLLFHESAEK